jgi:hypothetical protein
MEQRECPRRRPAPRSPVAPEGRRRLSAVVEGNLHDQFPSHFALPRCGCAGPLQQT